MLLKKKNFGSSSFDYMIVGLGNPGRQYESTRHNAGFMACDYIAEKFSAEFNKNKFNAIYGECTIANKRILMVKPQTFMNLSGEAVKPLADFYKIPSENIIIMFDDISLDVGKIRMRRKGSDGGHNGIKNIILHFGTNEIMRIKIGVGAKPNPDYDLKDWVLGKISADSSEDFKKALETVSKAAAEIINNGMDSAMNKYNS